MINCINFLCLLLAGVSLLSVALIVILSKAKPIVQQLLKWALCISLFSLLTYQAAYRQSVCRQLLHGNDKNAETFRYECQHNSYALLLIIEFGKYGNDDQAIKFILLCIYLLTLVLVHNLFYKKHCAAGLAAILFSLAALLLLFLFEFILGICNTPGPGLTTS